MTFATNNTDCVHNLGRIHFLGFKVSKTFMEIIATYIHKPIFYPQNYHDDYNIIRIAWSEEQVDYYITHNCLEFYQDAYHTRIRIRKRYVSRITWCCRLLKDLNSAWSCLQLYWWLNLLITQYCQGDKYVLRYMDYLVIHNRTPTVYWGYNTIFTSFCILEKYYSGLSIPKN